MRRLFADTFYWLAISNPADQWHQVVRAEAERLGEIHLVTTDEVLSEYLTGMAGLGSWWRKEAVDIVREVLTDRSVTVLSQSRSTFLAGLNLYEKRPDKGYSLTDCISMNSCRNEDITDILTLDHHFEQEGFALAIKP